MGECLDSIAGRKQTKYDVRDELIEDGVIDMVGVPHAKGNPLRLKLLKPDWIPGLVIANPSPDSSLPMPTVEYFACADGDCTTQVSVKGERCTRHKEVVCVN